MNPQQPPVPPTPDPFSAYTPPPQKKASKTWLYILLGVLGLCVVCAIIGVVGYNMIRPSVNEALEQVQGTLEVQVQEATSAVQVPLATAAPAQPQTQSYDPASGQDFNGNNPYISDVTMARGTSGDMLDPTDPTMVFGSSDTFHAVVSIKDAPENTVFHADWYAVDVGTAADPNTFIDGNDLTAGGSRNLDFSLSPNTGWPSGKYRVEISVNGTLDRVIHFTVE